MFTGTVSTCKVDVLIAGFPCVSLSPLTTTPGSIEDSDCSSGLGWTSTFQYIERHRPRMVLLENVQTLFASRKADGGQSPLPGSIRTFQFFFKDHSGTCNTESTLSTHTVKLFLMLLQASQICATYHMYIYSEVRDHEEEAGLLGLLSKRGAFQHC